MSMEATSVPEDVADDTAQVTVNEYLPARTLAPIDEAMRRGVGLRPRYAEQSLWDVRDALSMPSGIMAPGNITALVEFEEDAGYVAGAVEAMTVLHDGVRKVIEARESLKDDLTQTDAAKVVAITDLQTNVMQPAMRKVDAALASLNKAIGETELALRAPVISAGNSALAPEVRAFVRSLSTSERLSLLMTAINEGDMAIAGPVFGCPVPALAGVTKELQTSFTQQWNTKRNPQAARKLALMKAAVVKLEMAGSAYIGNLERVAGVKHTTVARLKARRDKVRTVIGGVIPG